MAADLVTADTNPVLRLYIVCTVDEIQEGGGPTNTPAALGTIYGGKRAEHVEKPRVTFKQVPRHVGMYFAADGDQACLQAAQETRTLGPFIYQEVHEWSMNRTLTETLTHDMTIAATDLVDADEVQQEG